MVRRRHFHVAELLRRIEDALVVRSNDDVGKGLCLFALLDNALDEGFACDEGERLAGEP